MPAGSGYLIYNHIKDVEDGIYFRVHGETPVGDLNFECYHLKKGLYEESAGTSRGKDREVQVWLSWRLTRLSPIMEC
jgi:hypothetical protein